MVADSTKRISTRDLLTDVNIYASQNSDDVKPIQFDIAALRASTFNVINKNFVLVCKFSHKNQDMNVIVPNEDTVKIVSSLNQITGVQYPL